MKAINYFFLLVSMSIFFSCSNDDTVIQSNQSQPTATTSRSLPPPTPGELRGFFDVKFNNGVEANMLFEYGNYVSYGSPTITDMLPLSGMRSTYTITGSIVEFTLFDGSDYTNYRLNYNSATAKFTGTYGFGFSYNNLGTLTGKKHLTGNSGFSFAKGIWMGSFNTGIGTPNYDYLMVFEEEDKVSVAAYATLYGSTPAYGTYTIIGNTIIGSYTYLSGSTYNFKADMIYGNNLISGTWGYGNSNSNGGNFSLSSWNFY
jgi:hypothetical protein